jgi:hypothetical protein
MNNIKKYTDEAAFTADASTRSNQAGHVISHVVATGNNYYEGKNLLLPLKAAEIGDVIVFDCVDSQIKVLKHGTINSSSLPSTLILGCVVVVIEGNTKYGIALRFLTSQPWAERHKYYITGFDLTNGGNVTLTFTGVYIKGDKTITYDAGTTLDSILDLFKTTVTTRCYISNGGIVIPLADYAKTTCVLTSSSPELTLTEVLPDWESTSLDTIFTQLGKTEKVGLLEETGYLRKNGTISYVASVFPSIFKSYFTNGGQSTANYSESDPWPLKESAFNTTDNPTLVAKYGDYDTYLKSLMVVKLSGRGQFHNREYKIYNDGLASELYSDPDGSSLPVFPAVYSMRHYGIVTEGFTTGFEDGNWYAPDCWLLYQMLSNLAEDMSDDINVTLRAIGADVINPRLFTPWTCQVYDTNSAVRYYPGYGALYYSYRFNTSHCRPFAAFEATE